MNTRDSIAHTIHYITDTSVTSRARDLSPLKCGHHEGGGNAKHKDRNYAYATLIGRYKKQPTVKPSCLVGHSASQNSSKSVIGTIS